VYESEVTIQSDIYINQNLRYLILFRVMILYSLTIMICIVLVYLIYRQSKIRANTKNNF